MKKINQFGFSPVVVLLVLILIVLVGFTGYYVYTNQNKKEVAATVDAKTTSNTNSSDDEKTAATPIDEREVYMSKALGISLKLPAGWTASETTDGNDMVTIKSSGYAETTNGIGASVPTKGAQVAIITTQNTGSKLQDVDLNKTPLGYNGGKFTSIKVGKQDGIEYVWAYEGPSVTSVSFVAGNKVIRATYASPNNSSTDATYSDFKSMLESIK